MTPGREKGGKGGKGLPFSPYSGKKKGGPELPPERGGGGPFLGGLGRAGFRDGGRRRWRFFGGRFLRAKTPLAARG